MYSLLSGLVKYVLKKDEYCVLIIGLDNAGKTTLLEQVRWCPSWDLRTVIVKSKYSIVGESGVYFEN
jgi:stage III sporulation protein SpoIIIAA